MGIGGKFWDILRPYAHFEGPDYLRDKRVAVDLSYWIVQHETAIKGYVRKPHLRLTFFRTINLFSKFGAFPVFVVDGTPSPLKSKARILRFFRASGIPTSGLPVPEEGVSVERNRAFVKCVEECVELLELFGMPVVKANGEAEALCAQLNREGHVDACITADSDAFLFGAKCVIKCLKPNAKEPFECYHMSDIEAGLGLKRNHLIAISLLVGNDHDLNGVQGVGIDTALRFVQTFSEEEILTRLKDIGNGIIPLCQDGPKVVDNLMVRPCGSLAKSRTLHCSFCGHPGSKRAHLKSSCEYCGITSSTEGCTRKPEGFKCSCSSCEKECREKEQQKHENWQMRVCNKIASEPKFPNNDIVELYLCNRHGDFNGINCDKDDDGPRIVWTTPDTDLLVDFLVFHQLWDPSYIRQRLIPMLSTIYLREIAGKPEKPLLYGQYVFHSIHRVKTRYGHQSYVIKWGKAGSTVGNPILVDSSQESNEPQEDIEEIDEGVDQLDEENVPQIHVDGGCSFLLTDENMELIHGAFPEEVNSFWQEKELKESKRGKSLSARSAGAKEKSQSTKVTGVQLSITEFYRSTKGQYKAKPGEEPSTGKSQDDEKSSGKRKDSSSNLSKSARRRLLFE